MVVVVGKRKIRMVSIRWWTVSRSRSGNGRQLSGRRGSRCYGNRERDDGSRRGRSRGARWRRIRKRGSKRRRHSRWRRSARRRRSVGGSGRGRSERSGRPMRKTTPWLLRMPVLVPVLVVMVSLFLVQPLQPPLLPPLPPLLQASISPMHTQACGSSSSSGCKSTGRMTSPCTDRCSAVRMARGPVS